MRDVMDYEKQHQKGKFHAYERIEMLLDKDSFCELEADTFSVVNNKVMKKDGVIIGYGKIKGKMVCVYAQDFTVCGGTLGRL